jgi:hypothetical protein
VSASGQACGEAGGKGGRSVDLRCKGVRAKNNAQWLGGGCVVGPYISHVGESLAISQLATSPTAGGELYPTQRTLATRLRMVFGELKHPIDRDGSRNHKGEECPHGCRGGLAQDNDAD